MTNMDVPVKRALILSETLKYVSQIIGEFDYCTAHKEIQKACGLEEEYCSQEIMGAFSIFIHRGLLICNRHNPVKNEIWHGSDTKIKASPEITHFIWADQVSYTMNDDEEA